MKSCVNHRRDADDCCALPINIQRRSNMCILCVRWNTVNEHDVFPREAKAGVESRVYLQIWKSRMPGIVVNEGKDLAVLTRMIGQNEVSDP